MPVDDKMFAGAFSHYIFRVKVRDRPLNDLARARLQSPQVRRILVEDVPYPTPPATNQKTIQSERKSRAIGLFLRSIPSPMIPATQNAARNQGMIPMPSRDTS
jgi:hypothetical protein